jgi:Uma2 family endonuclease
VGLSPLFGYQINRFTDRYFVYLSNHDIGHLTGADGSYMVSGERYIPDVGFIAYARQPGLSTVEGYVPNAPDLAVEVLSPGNTDEELAIKVANYLAAGTVVWMVKPVEKRVVVFAPGKPARTLGIDDTLDGGAVLPGFTLPVKAISPE